MAKKQPHAVQILDKFQVIDTEGRLERFVCLDYWHGDRMSGGKQQSVVVVVKPLLI